jgi:hypothetical protein
MLLLKQKKQAFEKEFEKKMMVEQNLRVRLMN